MDATPRAVVLLSGGLDSATVLAMALADGRLCHTVSFDYGQRSRAELLAAQQLSAQMGAQGHKVVRLDMGTIGGSALTDQEIDVPEGVGEVERGIPVTYVPARNTVFLSLALAWAEVLEAQEIHIGVNAVDYSGYPDCRPEFIRAYEAMANLATRAGTEGGGLTLHTPLIDLSKADIIRRGHALGVDYGLTTSCYQADEQGRACGVCDSCRLRRQGFDEAGIADPTRYYRPGPEI